MLEEQALDPDRHNRKGFTCGVSALDEYLQRFAVQQSKKGVTVVRVLVDDSMPTEILGYYILARMARRRPAITRSKLVSGCQ